MVKPGSDVPGNTKALHWQFIRDRVHDSWSWRSVRADGSIERTSAPHAEFGKAVSDAVRNGFNPAGQHWLIADREWCTHFEPGSDPVTVRRDADGSLSPHVPGSADSKVDGSGDTAAADKC